MSITQQTIARGAKPQRACRRPVAACAVVRTALLLATLLSMAAAHRAEAQIELGVDRFGVASVYRPGDPTAIRVSMTWRGTEPRPVQVIWEVENADGDITEQARTVVLNPGQTAMRWLYGRPGPRTEPQTTFTLRAFAEDDGIRGAELGVARFSPASATAAASAVGLDQRLVGILGEGRMGLDGYVVTIPTMPLAVGSHELTRLVSSLDARELPDRWEGLASFEALVWSTAAPAQLGLDESDALRQWIRGGGHLVIVLPQAGNPWGLGAAPSHPLHDLLPTRGPRRVEGVPFARLIDLLSKIGELLNNRAATTLTIWDADALDRGWEPLLAVPAPRDPDTGQLVVGEDGLGGAIVAIQRDLGFGHITLVGLDADAANRMRLQPGNFPQADAFWNRILARRSDTPLGTDIDAMERVRLINLSTTTADSLGGGSTVGRRIAMSGEAAVGTVAALILFVIYWILAGPGGFGLLKSRRLAHHSWVAFVGVAALFTIVAWLGGAALRQGNVRIQHVTFLDHVSIAGRGALTDEPQVQRASTWFAAYLPNYGPTRVAVDTQPGIRNLLTSWMEPPAGSPQRFPNTDRFTIPLGSPADYAVPARATAVQMEARWRGTLDSDWGSLPTAVDGAPIVERVELLPAPSIMLTGKLRHGLAGPLRRVVILHVSGLRTPLRTEQPPTSARPAPLPLRPGELLNLGRMAVRTEWAPGEVLDLGAELYGSGPLGIAELRSPRDGLAANIEGRYIDPISIRAGLTVDPSLTDDRSLLYMEILSLFSLMPPPPWTTPQQRSLVDRVAPRLLRNFGRDLDLGPWLARPCLIVIGVLEESASPVPLTVDGVEPPSSGLTVVRWICPLPVDADLIVPEPRPRADSPSADFPPNDAP